jgi:hypothetical protein
MDALLLSSIELESKRTPAERLAEALELMDWGIRLKRSQLSSRHPDASDAEIDTMLEAWLRRDD